MGEEQLSGGKKTSYEKYSSPRMDTPLKYVTQYNTCIEISTNNIHLYKYILRHFEYVITF